jgi:hypothetical protein
LADEPMEQEAFHLQAARLQSLEEGMKEYIAKAKRPLIARLDHSEGEEQRDLLGALHDLRIEAGPALIRLLKRGTPFADLATRSLRWARDPQVGLFLRSWIEESINQKRRASFRLHAWPPLISSVAEEFPYQAILFAFRGHSSKENADVVLRAGRDWDPTFRGIAVGTLGWMEGQDSSAIQLRLKEARHDPCAEVRQAARAALARLGERQALQWFETALKSSNRHRVVEAIQTIVIENITLLWPALDALADSEEPDIRYIVHEALEQMQEELDNQR